MEGAGSRVENAGDEIESERRDRAGEEMTNGGGRRAPRRAGRQPKEEAGAAAACSSQVIMAASEEHGPCTDQRTSKRKHRRRGHAQGWVKRLEQRGTEWRRAARARVQRYSWGFLRRGGGKSDRPIHQVEYVERLDQCRTNEEEDTSNRGLLPGEASGLPGRFGDLGLKKVAFGEARWLLGLLCFFSPSDIFFFFLQNSFYREKQEMVWKN
jgi:hypothetical protein